MKIKKLQLKNGLKVILNHSTKAPVVNMQTWVRTGSADERKTEEGISHFIEHLVFKGSQHFKVGEIAKVIESSGGELNAYTSFDETVFYITISKEFMETGFNALSQMMGFPIFEKAEVDNEREVVIEEIRRGKDSLSRRASQLMFSTAFKKHPYGIPVIGFEKNIKEMSVQKIKKFYQDRYSPKNMFLVVSGDFDQKTIKQQIEKFFLPFKSTKVRKTTRKREPVQTGFRVSVEKADFEKTICYMAWKIPSIKSKDIPALDIYSQILGSGESSRLFQNLRIKKSVVFSIGSGLMTTKDEGLFYIQMSLKPENMREALDDIAKTLDEVMKEGFTAEEITRTVTRMRSDDLFSLETVEGLSNKVGQFEFYFNNPNYFDEYLKLINKTDSTKILKSAQKFLNPKTLTTVCLTKEKDKEINQLLTDFSKNFKLKAPPKLKVLKPQLGKNWNIKTQATHNPIETIKLDNGVTLYLKETTDTNLISIKSAFLGGLRFEPANKSGSSELLSRTWLSGTKSRSENDIISLIENNAASFNTVSGRNTTGLSFECLRQFEDNLVDLYVDCLMNPTFETSIVEREKAVQLEQIKQKNDQPTQIAILAFQQMLFGSHPYAKDGLGTAEQLSPIGHKDLMDIWTSINQPENLKISIVGNFKKKKWLDELQKTGLVKNKLKFKIPNLDFHSPQKSNYRFIKLDKEQSHVVYGFEGITLTDKNSKTLDVLNSILEGMGGRLFVELREKKSLAYTVSPIRMDGMESGYYGAYIGCAPGKAKTSIELLEIEFKKLQDSFVSDVELERAKKYIIGRHDIDMQRVSTLSSEILYSEIYGISYEKAAKMKELIKQVTKEDIMKLSQQLFNRPHHTVVVGAIDPQA